MIRTLRVRHRTMIVALAVIAPVLFVAGLIARQAVPVMPDSAVAAGLPEDDVFEVVGRDDAAWGELPVRTIWLRASGDDMRRAVTLELTGPIKRPDLLVYWDDSANDGGVLSDQAHLLGRIGGRRSVTWHVPVRSESGRLLLYSSGWREIVASAIPPQAWRVLP